MPRLRKADLVTLIGSFVLAVGVYQLSGGPASAQNYLPQRQTPVPQQQALPTPPMCVYPNGASCPMTATAAPGTTCTCQQVWPGTGQVAGGPANQSWAAQQGYAGSGYSGYYGSQAAPVQTQPSLATPPPPADMVPIQ